MHVSVRMPAEWEHHTRRLAQPGLPVTDDYRLSNLKTLQARRDLFYSRAEKVLKEELYYRKGHLNRSVELLRSRCLFQYAQRENETLTLQQAAYSKNSHEQSLQHHETQTDHSHQVQMEGQILPGVRHNTSR